MTPEPDTGASLPLRLAFAAAIVGAFGSLLVVGAVAPEAMAKPLVAGVPLSLVLALMVIVTAVGTTGLYVLLANGRDR